MRSISYTFPGQLVVGWSVGGWDDGSVSQWVVGHAISFSLSEHLQKAILEKKNMNNFFLRSTLLSTTASHVPIFSENWWFLLWFLLFSSFQMLPQSFLYLLYLFI